MLRRQESRLEGSVRIALALLVVLSSSPTRAEDLSGVGIGSRQLEAGPPMTIRGPMTPPGAAAAAAPLHWAPLTSSRRDALMESVLIPVTFQVVAIAGVGRNRVAVLDYQGRQYIANPGTSIPTQDDAALIVKTIADDRVTVFDPRVQRLVSRSLPPM